MTVHQIISLTSEEEAAEPEKKTVHASSSPMMANNGESASISGREGKSEDIRKLEENLTAKLLAKLEALMNAEVYHIFRHLPVILNRLLVLITCSPDEIAINSLK